MIASVVEIETSIILASFGTLAGVIATMATVIWRTLQNRMDAQDKIIEHFREDVKRLTKGCGVSNCSWSKYRNGDH